MNNMIDFAFPYLLQVPSQLSFYPFAYILLSIELHKFASFAIEPSLLSVQFIREYTGKVDELVKDRIEAQKEVKAKEQEEKEMVAQQVTLECFQIWLTSYILLIFSVSYL